MIGCRCPSVHTTFEINGMNKVGKRTCSTSSSPPDGDCSTNTRDILSAIQLVPSGCISRQEVPTKSTLILLILAEDANVCVGASGVVMNEEDELMDTRALLPRV